MTRPGDQATVTVLVAVEPALAFEVFTLEIDQWWRRGPKYRHAGKRRGFIHIEPKLGGRLFESFEQGSAASTPTIVEVGRVTAWEPPSRFVFEWRNATFSADEKTEVEVTFAPSESGTVVTLRHRGWSAIRDNHPARHGNTGAAFSRMIGLYWGELMTSLRLHVASKS